MQLNTDSKNKQKALNLIRSKNHKKDMFVFNKNHLNQVSFLSFLEKLYQFGIMRNKKDEEAAIYRISKGSSTATITWKIPENEIEGNYQIIYEGDYKTRSEVVPFQGKSKVFQVKKK